MPLKEVSEKSGIDLQELTSTVNALAGMSNPVIIIGRDIIQTSNGHENLLLLAALVYLLNGRIYLLSELPNEQGLLDMGFQPDMLPCGRPLSVETFRKRCEELIETGIPSKPGLSYVEIIEAAQAGRIKALYVMGENVLLGLPDTGFVRGALENIDFLIVQDIFLSETGQIADVVLPALSWAEKEGTYTNLERRVQFTHNAIEGRGLEEWKIISEISKVLGFDMGYRNVKDIFAEISRISLIYRGITIEDIEDGKCLWPYKGEPLRHDVHLEGIDIPDIAAMMKKSENDKIYVHRNTSLFYSENSSRYSSVLRSITPEPYIEMSKVLAEKLSIAHGDYVTVSSESGRIIAHANIDPSLPENAVLVPNFENQGNFKIMKWKTNSLIRTPALDGNEIVIRK